MITKLICQLLNYDTFGHKGRLNFDPERVKDLGWTLDDQNDIFDPSYISDAPATAAKQRSHPMQLRSAKVQEVSLNNINIGDLLQSNSVIQWLSQYNTCIISVYSHSVHKLCIICFTPSSTHINTHMSLSFSVLYNKW